MFKILNLSFGYYLEIKILDLGFSRINSSTAFLMALAELNFAFHPNEWILVKL